MGKAAGRRAGAGQRVPRGTAAPRGAAVSGARPGARGRAWPPGGPGQPQGAARAAAAGRDAAGSQSRGRPAEAARRVAYDVLAAVSGRDAYANLLLASALRERGLGGPDAALATELVYGTLRNMSYYDAVISTCADRDLARIDAPLLDML